MYPTTGPFAWASALIFGYCLYMHLKARQNPVPPPFLTFTRTLTASYLLLWLLHFVDSVFAPIHEVTRLHTLALTLVVCCFPIAAIVAISIGLRHALQYMYLVRRRNRVAPQGPLPSSAANRPETSNSNRIL